MKPSNIKIIQIVASRNQDKDGYTVGHTIFGLGDDDRIYTLKKNDNNQWWEDYQPRR